MQTSQCISKRASQKAGGALFSSSAAEKKVHANPGIYQSTGGHPRVPKYQSIVLSTMHCSPIAACIST